MLFLKEIIRILPGRSVRFPTVFLRGHALSAFLAWCSCARHTGKELFSILRSRREHPFLRSDLARSSSLPCIVSYPYIKYPNDRTHSFSRNVPSLFGLLRINYRLPGKDSEPVTMTSGTHRWPELFLRSRQQIRYT